MADLDIAAFLRARFDEDEFMAGQTHWGRCGIWRDFHEVCDCYAKPRALADVKAKRQILDLHDGEHEYREMHEGTYAADWPSSAPYGSPGGAWRHASSEYFEAATPCPTLRLLALPYVGHPEFREEWKP